MIDETDFILPGLPRSLYLQLLRSESRSEEFSDAKVRVSLLLDVDKGAVQSQRRYAAVWGWSHKKVRLRWDELWQDVALLATSNGRQLDSPTAQKLPPEWLDWVRAERGSQQARSEQGRSEQDDEQSGPDQDDSDPGAHEGHSRGTGTGTENPPEDAEKPDPGHSRGTAGAQQGHASIHPTSTSSFREGDSRARGKAFAHPAVLAYEHCIGGDTQPVFAEKIAAYFGDALPDERLTDWMAHVTTYVDSPTRNPVNVLGIIQTFREHEQRQAAPTGPGRGVSNRGRAKASDIDPADAYATLRAATRGAAD